MTFKEFVFGDGRNHTINGSEYTQRGVRSKFVTTDGDQLKDKESKSAEKLFGKSKKFTK